MSLTRFTNPFFVFAAFVTSRDTPHFLLHGFGLDEKIGQRNNWQGSFFIPLPIIPLLKSGPGWWRRAAPQCASNFTFRTLSRIFSA